MELKDALSISQEFILRHLYGTLGTLEPVKADYNGEEGVWILEFTYQNWRIGKPMKVTISLDNETGKVLSFDTKE